MRVGASLTTIPRLISVAMATYNGQAHIAEQLESICAQTKTPCELVIYDDDSEDGTLAICEAFGRSAAFPVHIHRQRRRVGYRRNFLDAALACRGDLIAFSDQDDVWLPGKLEACAQALHPADALLCYHNAQIVDVDLRPLGRLDRFAAPSGGFAGASTLPHPWFGSYGFTQVLRRELLAHAAGISQVRDHNDASQHLAHDQWFFWLAVMLGRVVYVPDILALYRQHGSNVNGAGARRSRSSRLLGLTPHFDGYRSNALGAGDRVAALVALRGEAGEQAKPALDAAEALYAGVARISAARHALYTSLHWGERLARLGKLLGSGAYRPFARGGLGPLALMRDLVCTLVLRPALLLRQVR